jgi:predicted enzyme related to lactoylglutathione lyase
MTIEQGVFKICKMKRTSLTILALAISFCFGFTLKAVITKQSNEEMKMKKVTGIGGIFFKCKDPDRVKDWYKTNLGLNTTEYGVNFEWREAEDPTKTGYTQWSTFSETTKYFEPSARDFMINYRVENLEALVEELKKNGVTILDAVQTFDYGKFVHILDVEGNKVELWEPTDQ